MLPNRISGKLVLQRLTAADPSTPGDLLASLSNVVNDVDILTYIAGNRSSPANVLALLAFHESVDVRIAVGENFSTPTEVLRHLACDESDDVRFNLADNHNVPVEILKILANDEHPWISWRAQKTMNKLEEWKELMSGGGKKSAKIEVLIAEDNEFIRTLISKALNSDSDIKTVCGTSDGESTIKECLRLKPHIVLMDIKMPGLDGVEATRKIKEACPETKIVMVTGSDREEDIASAFKAGANGYFLKSTSFDNLPDCVKSVNNNASWLDPGISSIILKQCFQSPAETSNEERSLDYRYALNALNHQIDDAMNGHEFEEAILFCKASIKLCERVYGTKSQQTAGAMAKLAEIHYFNRQYKESETVLLKAIESHQPSLNQADDETDFVIDFLAKAAEAAGQKQQAELYYTWSLRIRERMGDEEKIKEVADKLESLHR